MSNLGERTCKSVWGDGWACPDADGNSGGILSIWNDKVFGVVSTWYARGVLVVNGILREDGKQVCILNVYATCVTSEKLRLWDLMGNIISHQNDVMFTFAWWEILMLLEMRMKGVGKGNVSDHRDIVAFDNFINDSNLIEIPLSGRSFTWYLGKRRMA